MKVSREFLLEAVGLSLLVALILISMQLFQRASKIVVLLEEGQKQQIAELEEYEIIKYDGMIVDGMTAVSYIKKMNSSYGLEVKVTTSKGEFWIEGTEDYRAMRNIVSEKYINPLKQYRCEVIRDENSVISEIRIVTEQEENK